MRARLSRKRRRIPEDGDETIHRSKRRRRRSSLSDIHCDFQILLRKLSPNDYKKIVLPKCAETVKPKNITLLKPRLFLPRLDIETFMELKSLVTNACSPDKEENRTRSKQEDKKSFEVASKEKISSHSREPETATTNSLLAVRTEPIGISLPKAKNTVVIDLSYDDRLEEKPLSRVVKHRVLKDVRNVVNPKEISYKLKNKESNIFLSAVGRENVNCEMWSRVKRKVPPVNYCEETPIKKKHAKLVVCLKRMDPQVLEEEFWETSFEAEEPIDDILRKTKKSVKTLKTRVKGECPSESGVQFREVHVEKVKNITLSELRNRDRKSVVTSYKRKIIHSITSSKDSENRKNVSKSKRSVKMEKNSRPSPKVTTKLKTSRKFVEKKELSVSFKDELSVIENLQKELASRPNSDLRRKSIRSSTPNISEDQKSGNKRKLNMSDLSLSLPGPSSGNTFSVEGIGNTEKNTPFLGFSESTDLSSHGAFCSYVMTSLTKKKRRMTKKEAAQKTELINLCKKTLERSKPVKCSQRLAMKRMKAELTAKIEAQKIECLINSVRLRTPCVRLNRLNETDLSSYRITPLREERTPLPSKTEDDYGIDDVNTDDSTDDDENPKKVVPAWAEVVKENLRNSFNPQESIDRFFTRAWMNVPILTTSIRNHLFSKRKTRPNV